MKEMSRNHEALAEGRRAGNRRPDWARSSAGVSQIAAMPNA
jgi:hypothetical protein